MTSQNSCFCVLPSENEEQVGVIPGSQPGTALRLQVETSEQGYVRLEHLAFSPDLGWYTQKSFCVPGEMVKDLVCLLNQSRCRLPNGAQRPGPSAAPSGDCDCDSLKFPGCGGTSESKGSQPGKPRPLRRLKA